MVKNNYRLGSDANSKVLQFAFRQSAKNESRLISQSLLNMILFIHHNFYRVDG